MKIVLVVDQFDDAVNGTVISARRFAGALRARGNEVRIIACGRAEMGKYQVRRAMLPPALSRLLAGQGLCVAVPERRAFERAAAWADVVHFLLPSPLAIAGVGYVEKSAAAYTAAFHCQPENVTYSLHLGNSKAANDWLYNHLRDGFYNRFTHIHCPSMMIARQLRAHGYTAALHVISNGISPEYGYDRREKEPWMEGKFCIIMVGRYSGEKRQDELIRACVKSRHSRRIQLILAGRGPREKRYRRLCRRLPNPAVLAFYSQTRLQNLLSRCDLYVHASDAEIEAMSCMEAFASGLVPVIADSPRSATPQFALDERSLFPAGDVSALARKIDYWIEHPKERAEMGKRYAEYAGEWSLDRSAGMLEEMFRQAIGERGRRG